MSKQTTPSTDTPIGATGSNDSRKIEFTTYDVQINNFLLGEVLTIVDAAITNEQQCKAVKDIIKQQFRRRAAWMAELHNTTGSAQTVDSNE